MLQRMYPRFVDGYGATALLLMRVAMGTAFMMHGFPKIQHPASWMGPGSPVPAAFQILAAVAEFFGGMGVFFGVLTPIAALGILSVMITAFALVHGPSGHPYVGDPGSPSWEIVGIYASLALLLMGIGPGKLSGDYIVLKRCGTMKDKDSP